MSGSVSSEFLFRYVDIVYAPPLDEFENPTGRGSLHVELRTYLIDKRTATGAWVFMWESASADRRFVRLNARKKFACETREEAIKSFIARKKAQMRHLRNQFDRAQEALSAGQRIEKEKES